MKLASKFGLHTAKAEVGKLKTLIIHLVSELRPDRVADIWRSQITQNGNIRRVFFCPGTWHQS